jgi:hypothetical protein
MSEDNKNENAETPQGQDAGADSTAEQQEQASTQSGPKFTESPDPLAGLKKATSDLLGSMEGKTVSMKTYVGTIIAVVVLMLLARCGG